MTTTAAAKAARRDKHQVTRRVFGAPKRPVRKRPVRKPAALPAKDMWSPAERFAALLRASVDYQSPPREKGAAPSPEHRDLLRMALARRMMTFMRLPPRCGEPACRRSRRCVGPTMRCRSDFPRPQLTEEESAAAAADFRAKLMQRAREMGWER